jgi:phosphate transport system permease protein
MRLRSPILGGIIFPDCAWPAMKEYGFAFLWTQRWAPSADPPVLAPWSDLRHAGDVGDCDDDRHSGRSRHRDLPDRTLPQWLRRPIGMAVELLAGVPSIIYGMGFLRPWAVPREHVPALHDPHLEGMPVLGAIFAGPPSYLSLFNAALILAIMVLPFITAISVDVFKTVPPVLKEAAYGVGCTTWEVVRNVVIPYTRVGVIGGVMLAPAARSARRWLLPSSSETRSGYRPRSCPRHDNFGGDRQRVRGGTASSVGLILLGLLLFVLTFFAGSRALMLMRLETKAGK